MVSPDKLKTYFESLRHNYPCHTNRASMLGDPCERRLVYWRTAWEKASLPPVWLQEAFEMGKDTERQAIDRLRAAGYQIRVQQADEVWRDFQITGHIEGEISEDGEKWLLFEIKALEKYRAFKIENWRDMLANPIYKRYPAQGQLYMLLRNVTEMVFIIIPKGTFGYRFIPMELDLEYAESLLKKAERINRHVVAGTLPDQPCDLGACGCDENCSFFHICLPERDYGAGAELETDQGFIDLLEERERLKPQAKEFDEIDGQVKAKVKGRPHILAGGFEITGKEQVKKSFTVPVSTFWVAKIRRIK